MISHTHIGVNQFDNALRFYGAVLAELGLELRFRDETRPWAGWSLPGETRPLFLIGAPEDGEPAAPGNGNMVAVLARSREAVDCAFAAGIAAGGTDGGPPRLRPAYHPYYYGCYLRDPEGNKIAVVCHDAP